MSFDKQLAWSAEGPDRLNRRAIPNIDVTDQYGVQHQFYSDLVKDRTVLIAFTSISHDAHYPCTEKLLAVRDALDSTPASMAEILTITVEPDMDDQATWSTYAERAGARFGWRFLHADADATEILRSAFYSNRGPGVISGERPLWRLANLLDVEPQKAVMSCSFGLLRYGNEAHDLWAGVPVRAQPDAIADRVVQIFTDSSLCSTWARRRGGPFPKGLS